MSYSRIIFSAERIKQIISELAEAVHAVYQNSENCLALVVLDGALAFSKDLLAALDVSLETAYIKASSYSGTQSTGTVSIDGKGLLKSKIAGKHILLIDDIYDTGLTLSRIIGWVNTCDPKSIRTCVLLEKEIEHAKKIDIDFLGAKIENVFAIGYGLDHDQQFRDLPFIAELSADPIRQNSSLRLDQGL